MSQQKSLSNSDKSDSLVDIPASEAPSPRKRGQGSLHPAFPASSGTPFDTSVPAFSDHNSEESGLKASQAPSPHKREQGSLHPSSPPSSAVNPDAGFYQPNSPNLPPSKEKSDPTGKVVKIIFVLAGTAICFLIILYFHMRLSGTNPNIGVFSGFLNEHREVEETETSSDENMNRDDFDGTDSGPASSDLTEDEVPEENGDADKDNNDNSDKRYESENGFNGSETDPREGFDDGSFSNDDQLNEEDNQDAEDVNDREQGREYSSDEDEDQQYVDSDDTSDAQDDDESDYDEDDEDESDYYDDQSDEDGDYEDEDNGRDYEEEDEDYEDEDSGRDYEEEDEDYEDED